jgi:Tol biopolymer transport system component
VSLAPGTRLGPYEIIAPIGAGGMGEVSRGRDTKLIRDVAIKVLPESFALDADRVARFTREAQVLASLNHPNIAQIYGIEGNALVMELVAGEDLSAIISRGPLSLADALPIAKQIADALEAAHEQGIVHRDLKPQNIKVRADGTVKVLDFGLAKAVDPTASPGAVANSPTMTANATAMGMIIGTAAYMSPEQARGRSVDKRADIWAFGVVLYEMLTGQAAFAGDTITDIIAAVVTREPEWTSLSAGTPASLRQLLGRCLEKDPKKRLRDIGEARLEIERLAAVGSSASGVSAPATVAAMASPGRHPRYKVAAAAVVVVAIGIAWWLGHQSSAGGAAWSQFTQLTDASGVETGPTISPDGSTIAYASNASGSWDIYAQRVGGRNPVVVVGDPKVDERWPAFSPDGKLIAFNQGSGGIFIVGATGESVKRLSDFGAHVLVTSDIAVDWAPVWSPDGKYIYFASDRGGSMGIWRAAIDEASGNPVGEPEPIVVGVDVAMDLPHLSGDGAVLVFRSLNDSANPAAIQFDPATERAGDVRLLQHRTGRLVPTDASPDGKWLSLCNLQERQQDIFVMRTDGTQLSRLTDDAARDWSPRFTADNSGVVFQSNKAGPYDGWSIKLDGSGRTRLTDMTDASARRDASGPSFAPDGKRLAVQEGVTNADILIGTAPWPLKREAAQLIKPQRIGDGFFSLTYWSRDGRWLVGSIISDAGTTKGNALYDVASGTYRQLSDDAAGQEFAWMPGGQRVLYWTKAGKLVIQDITTLKRHDVDVRLPFPPDVQFALTASPDGRTLYYGAQQVEANIWKVEQPKVVNAAAVKWCVSRRSHFWSVSTRSSRSTRISFCRFRRSTPTRG